MLTGHTAAYSQLVHKYSSMAYTLAYQVVQNREDAEEIAQDAFVKAFNALATFRQQSRFSTWLCRIVINTALNNKKLCKPATQQLTEGEEQEAAQAVLPALQLLHNHCQKQYIQQALAVLRTEERLCLVLFYLHDLAVNEIQDLTGLSASNVKVLLHRGRKQLYQQLKVLLKKEIENLI